MATRVERGEDGWLSLVAYGAKLLVRAMAGSVLWDGGTVTWDNGQTLWYESPADEPDNAEWGDSPDLRDRMLRYRHEISGEVEIRQADPVTGTWLGVAPNDWQAIDWTFGRPLGGPRPVSALAAVEVREIALSSLPSHKQRVRLLREAWLRAGSVMADWPARQARQAALVLHPEARSVLMAVTTRQLRRDFCVARADKKPPKAG